MLYLFIVRDDSKEEEEEGNNKENEVSRWQ